MVQVDLEGTLDSASLVTAGQVGPGNISSYEQVKAFTIDGQSLPGQRVTWTLDGLNGAGYLAVELPGTITTGERWTISGAFVGGGGGVSSSGGGGAGGAGGAAVSARFGTSQAVTGTGSITVLATKPLQLRLDLTLTDDQTVTHRITGDAAFSFRRERVVCS
jgi:hypothetical protein